MDIHEPAHISRLSFLIVIALTGQFIRPEPVSGLPGLVIPQLYSERKPALPAQGRCRFLAAAAKRRRIAAGSALYYFSINRTHARGAAMDYTSKGIDRRDFLKLGMLAAGCAALGATASAAAAAPQQQIRLAPLPYPEDALAPVISAKTLGLHYGRHHKGYVEKTNQLIAGTDLEGAALEEIIRKTSGNKDLQPVFNNAAQAWNHAFLWRSMRPQSAGGPPVVLAQRLDKSFGSFENFKKQFVEAAVGQFGSGWAWLVEDGGALRIVQTANAGTPLAGGRIPLLTMDVWEHAYYLDYQNRRAEYAQAVVDRLLNWDFAAANASTKLAGE
jgi:Fe-Mn family superoxide dismutase